MAGRLGRVLVDGKDCGAGFALGLRLVITANHVVHGRSDKPVMYVPTGGQPIGAERVQSNVGHDAAILWLVSDVGEFLPASVAARGARWVVESPPPTSNDPQLHGTITTARMTIQNARGQPVEVVQLEVDEQLGDFGGYSGSAVLDSLGRTVLGLLVEQKPLRTPVVLGERQAASNVLYAVPIGDVITANGLPVRASPPLQFDRLPPGPADRDQVCLYLAALIRWLNADPWPLDPRLGGPVLSPASIEQKLTIREAQEGTAQDLGTDGLRADDLADRCTRLVVLGDPGTGKTWFAMRTARRCAEAALNALTSDDANVAEVELPLFTTCSLLSAANGDIRDAAISSALDRLGDLGGTRIAAALRALFAERNAATLLVIDSLDEARDPDDRLRQADTLPWRIIVTSRASAWKQQLAIQPQDDSHQVGWLQQLRYPEDVELVIARWFAADLDHGRALTEQIAARKDLQQAATVPLLLAFFCILGGNAPLPDTRREVYAQVMWRLLSGLWRGTDDHDADPPARAFCLRGWAWDGAVKDKRTGIGTWDDEIITPYARLTQSDRAAVDHVAPPLGLPDLATGATRRRFIHRSLREHLTAEHVATHMNADQAAAELLSHVWYDPDWEYAGPAALAMHPKRDQVLKQLLSQTAQAAYIPDELASVDGCWELRRFLTQVAVETHEIDWTAESVAIIGRAGFDIAVQEGFPRPAPAGWPTTAREILCEVLAQLTAASPSETQWSAEALRRLGPEASDLSQARRRVLDLLDTADAADIPSLAEVLVELGPEAADLVRARFRVLGLLDGAALWNASRLAEVLTKLGPEAADLVRARFRVLGLLDAAALWNAVRLAEVLTKLGPEAADLARARHRVLHLLNTTAEPREAKVLANVLDVLIPESADLARARGRVLDLLGTAAEPDEVERLVEVLRRLGPDPADLAQARSRVRDLLDSAPSSWEARRLAKVLCGFGLGTVDLARTRGRVLDLLGTAAEPDEVERLVEVLRGLGPDPADLARARSRVLDLLDSASSWKARQLLAVLTGPGPEPGDQARARFRVLGQLNSPADAMDSKQLNGLSPEPSDLARARMRVLKLLGTKGGAVEAKQLVEMLNGLSPQAGDLARARKQVLKRLGTTARAVEDIGLVEVLTALGPEPADLARARSRVLGLLDTMADPDEVERLVEALRGLRPEAADLARARSRIRDLLDSSDRSWDIRRLVDVLTGSGPEPGDLARARSRVLDLLGTAAEPYETGWLAKALDCLSPEPGDLAQVRSRVLDLLGTAAEPDQAEPLVAVLRGLGPDPADLAQARSRVLDLLDSAPSWKARQLLAVLTGPGPEPGDQARARSSVLDLLGSSRAEEATQPVEPLGGLCPAPGDLARARSRVLDLLLGSSRAEEATQLVEALGGLCPEPSDLARARSQLLDLLDTTGLEDTIRLIEMLRELRPEPGDLARGRGHVKGLMEAADYADAARLARVLRELNPVAADLAGWELWATPPRHDLLATVRRNSSLRSWLEILPTLAGVATTPNLGHAEGMIAVARQLELGGTIVSRRPNLPRVEVQQAEGMVAAALRLEPGATVVSRHQESFIDETPFSLDISFYPMALVEQGAVELIEASGIKQGESRYLRDILAIEGHQEVVRGRAASEKECAFFKLGEGASVVESSRLALSAEGNPVRLTITIRPADRNLLGI